MAQVTYRGNLSAKVFPLIAEYFGPTVIVQGQDQNFQRQLTSSEDLDKDRGIPQVYYCHNVMPSAEGFQSVGYTNVLNGNGHQFNSIFTLRDGQGNEVFFANTDSGKNYVLPFGESAWWDVASVDNSIGKKISTATLNGQTYLYFANVGCFLYIDSVMKEVELLGLDKNSVTGITSSAGYMIAWTDNSIAWSSTVDHTNPLAPIDFVPSLATGAGGGNVEVAKGKIVLCVNHYLGFIIYTTENAVSAVYSGNSRFPFNLREIVNSGGLVDGHLVSADSGSGNHYAYTTSGLQLISVSQTQVVFPEITDFLSGRYFEDFDDTVLEFTRTVLTSPMKKSLNVISDRYLVISYGMAKLTHALVYDTIMKRFGKLKIDHITCFEWKQLGGIIETPRQSIGFLQDDGSIRTVDFSYTSDSSNGVLLLGKYQLSRTRLLQLQEVELENIRTTDKFKLYNLVSYDGKVLQAPVEGVLAGDFGAAKSYRFHQTGINHTLLAKGSFYFSAIVMKFNIHGRR